MSTTTDQLPSSAETPSTTSSREMRYWVTSRRGAVEIAAFSNPPHNYLTKVVIDELEQLVAEWRDPSIRAVVIQSHDQDAGFFTQYSVEELDGLASDPALSRYAGPLVRGYKAIFDQMTALPKVIIAAMNGDAMGGGFELTLACDLRIGQHGDFRYGNPEVRAGVIPGAGGTQRVTRLVGLARALDWVLLGRIVRPEVALELGLVHEVVDDAPARALELAEEIACLPPMSVANAKRSGRSTWAPTRTCRPRSRSRTWPGPRSCNPTMRSSRLRPVSPSTPTRGATGSSPTTRRTTQLTLA